MSTTQQLAPLPELARPALRVLITTIRNPLDALPKEIFALPMLRTRVLHRRIIHLADPGLIREVLVGHAADLDKGAATRRALGPALGDGLLTADGAHWRSHRRAMSPMFQPARVAGFVPAMLAAAATTRDRLRAAADTPIDIGQAMTQTTFDIIVETMLSGPQVSSAGAIDAEGVADAVARYLRQTGWAIAASLVGLPGWLPHPGKSTARRAARFMRRELAHLITARRAAADDRPDLINLLLAATDPETGAHLDDTDIVDNVLTFITAGHETTAQALTWTLDLLGQHPAIAAAVRAEIAAVTAGAPITAAHIDRLAYTRQVFSEAMRLYPPAPLMTRQVTRQFRIGAEIFAPGTLVVVPIYALHRHALLWPSPDQFVPDRFAPGMVRDRYAYMPFGAGPRSCIGAVFAITEAIAILATILPSIRLEPTTTPAPPPRMETTLRPSRPILMIPRAA